MYRNEVKILIRKWEGVIVGVNEYQIYKENKGFRSK